MTISITPELETRLRHRAERKGEDLDAVVEVLLSAALEWEAQEQIEAVAGIQRGLDASAAGRVRPASEVLADMRARHAQAGG